MVKSLSGVCYRCNCVHLCIDKSDNFDDDDFDITHPIPCNISIDNNYQTLILLLFRIVNLVIINPLDGYMIMLCRLCYCVCPSICYRNDALIQLLFMDVNVFSKNRGMLTEWIRQPECNNHGELNPFFPKKIFFLNIVKLVSYNH